jgi:protein-S-isoprenylcysteine O-methyltransferase Ste14
MTALLVDIFIAAYFTIIGLHYTATTVGLKHRDGRTRVYYGVVGSRTWTMRWVFNLFRLAILLLVNGRLFFPAIDSLIVLFSFPAEDIVRATGAVTMLVSFFFISYTHAYMASEWQSGLNSKNFKLLSEGPYHYCRHPLFSAVMLGMLGFTMALPSLFTLICLIAGVWAITRQAGEEEKQLRHEPEYKAYVSRTGRWPLSNAEGRT